MATDSRPRTKLTYADYGLIPEDGKRHEIVDGEHLANPAPTPYHQLASGRLQVQLSLKIDQPGLGLVYSAPIDVQLSEHDVVQPDLVVVLHARRAIVTPTRIQGSPDLVIEITSPSTARTDRRQKLDLYQSSAVPEYWVVDPEEYVVEEYMQRDGRYSLESRRDAEIVRRALPDVRVDLTRVW